MATLSRVRPRHSYVAVLAFTLVEVVYSGSASALDTQLIAPGFIKPLFLTAPERDSRLFVVEQDGRIKVRSGGTWSTFLDITSQVNATGERGLLGLAFDPNYRSNGTFYVDYIDSSPAHNTQIARFTVSSNPNVANPAGTPILTIAQPDGLSNHKAGWIGFRPGENGNLYIATGDGGGSNDLRSPPEVDNNAQNTNRLLGKILRIDVHADAFPNDANRNYAIPIGNPFATAGGAPEVWDYGVRNPYRNSFDRNTGDFYIADVGEDTKEELNFESASSPGGVNYGWRLREGTIPTPTPSGSPVGGPLPGAQDPAFEYDHNGASAAITGGYVYRGSLLHDLQGTYFFADSSTGQIWSIRIDPTTGKPIPNSLVDRTTELDPLDRIGSVVSFGEDAFGNLYIVDYSGKVFEIVPEPGAYAIMLFAIGPLAWLVARRSRRSASTLTPSRTR